MFSLFSLVIAYLNFTRKSGISVKGGFTTTRSAACKDYYISNITLENQKDKTIPIFSIHLWLGYDCYVELIDFKNSPLLLKPYEVYFESFEPLELYRNAFVQFNINALLLSESVEKRLVLSTPFGKHVVSPSLGEWEPHHENCFRFAPLQLKPYRLQYKNKCYGSQTVFLVILRGKTSERVFAIDPSSLESSGLHLTSDSVQSKASLESYLKSNLSANDRVSDFHAEVIDLNEQRQILTIVHSVELDRVDNNLIHHLLRKLLFLPMIFAWRKLRRRTRKYFTRKRRS